MHNYIYIKALETWFCIFFFRMLLAMAWFLALHSVVGNEVGNQPPMNLKVRNFNLKLE